MRSRTPTPSSGPIEIVAHQPSFDHTPLTDRMSFCLEILAADIRLTLINARINSGFNRGQDHRRRAAPAGRTVDRPPYSPRRRPPRSRLELSRHGDSGAFGRGGIRPDGARDRDHARELSLGHRHQPTRRFDSTGRLTRPLDPPVVLTVMTPAA